ncbi:MAG: biofilm regulation phosphoprotein SiaC [Magnetospirillum sp. WYHS-4]
MNNIHRDATASTPLIHFDWGAGVLEIRGESYPENSYEFYEPILDGVATFLAEERKPIRLEVDLSYLNTSTIKCMMDLLDMLDQVSRKGRSATVNWYCDPENDRAVEMAEEFKEDVALPFNILTKEI